MAKDVGAINGDTVSEDGSDALAKDYRYVAAMHGHRTSGFGGTHDVIEESTRSEQRIHLQSYFDDGPYPNDGGSQYPDSVFYRVEPPAYYSNDQLDFRDYYPTDSSLGSSQFPSFSVGVPLSPYLSVGIANIVPRDDGGDVTRVPNEYCQWDINLDPTEDLPSSQDDSDGVRVNIVDMNPDDASYHDVFAESNYTWFQYAGGSSVGADYYTTNSAKFSARFDIETE